MADLVTSDPLGPVIHARYPLEATREALGVLAAEQQFGKIVPDIRASQG